MAETLAREQYCTLGLSGGSTPKDIYTALGKEKLPWERVRIFLVDERFVGSDDPRSNQFLLRSTLLRSAPIPEENIVFPDTSLPIAVCVDRYAREIADLFVQPPDIVILGMGEDGHIASLFPPVDFGKAALVLHTTTDRFDVHDRISVGVACLASARRHLFLLKGKGKGQTWNAMMESREHADRWPAKALLKEGRTTVITQE